MIDKTETQVNGLIAELRTQRDLLADRAANLAAELAYEKSEKALLQGRIAALDDELKRAT